MGLLSLYWNLLTNYFICISYSGQNYSGFQAQSHENTVQDKLFTVLRKIFGNLLQHSFSGRTDAGVHAEEQFISFTVCRYVNVNKLHYALSRMLPCDIGVKSVRVTKEYIDARKSAISREYKYLFSTGDLPQYLCSRITLRKSLKEISYYNKLAKEFIGKHDFVNFRKKGSSEKSTIRTIKFFRFNKFDVKDIYSNNTFQVYEAHIIANSFLYRMVRNIMGVIFEIVEKDIQEIDLKSIVNAKSGMVRYIPAPANGLTLYKVNY